MPEPWWTIDIPARPERLHERVRRAREEAGFKSQTDAAPDLGINQSTLNRIEAGKSRIRGALLLKMARVYGLDERELALLSLQEAALREEPTPDPVIPGPSVAVPATPAIRRHLEVLGSLSEAAIAALTKRAETLALPDERL